MQHAARDRLCSGMLLFVLVLAAVPEPLGSAHSASSPLLHSCGSSSGNLIPKEASSRYLDSITAIRSLCCSESNVHAGCRCVGGGLQRLRGGEEERRRIRLRSSSSCPPTATRQGREGGGGFDSVGSAPTSGGNLEADDCQEAGRWEEPVGFEDAPIPVVERNFRPGRPCEGGEEGEGGILVDGGGDGGGGGGGVQDDDEDKEWREQALLKDAYAKVGGGMRFMNPLTEMDSYLEDIEESEGERAEREAVEREMRDDMARQVKEGLFEGRDIDSIPQESALIFLPVSSPCPLVSHHR